MNHWIEREAFPTTTAAGIKHDETVPLPPGVEITDESWRRFGALDQRLVVTLQERFGSWTEDAAKGVVDTVRASLSADVLDDLEAATRTHYKAAQRWEVQSEALMLRELRERAARGDSDAGERFNAAESAMSTLGAVARWDLFNRAGAHDLIVFHGGGSGGTVAQKRDQIDCGYILYGGYSWTPFLEKTDDYGDVVTATVMPIRILFLNWNTPISRVAEEHVHEREVAPRQPLVLHPLTSTAFDRTAVPDDVRGYFTSGQLRSGSDWARLSNFS